MDGNTVTPAKGYEPYVGMPIYLDDYDNMLDLDDMPGSGDDMMDEMYHCAPEFENWPIAMAYVPMQKWGELYEPAEALQNGTVFPCLDLKFLGGGGK